MQAPEEELVGDAALDAPQTGTLDDATQLPPWDPQLYTIQQSAPAAADPASTTPTEGYYNVVSRSQATATTHVPPWDPQLYTIQFNPVAAPMTAGARAPQPDEGTTDDGRYYEIVDVRNQTAAARTQPHRDRNMMMAMRNIVHQPTHVQDSSQHERAATGSSMAAVQHHRGGAPIGPSLTRPEVDATMMTVRHPQSNTRGGDRRRFDRVVPRNERGASGTEAQPLLATESSPIPDGTCTRNCSYVHSYECPDWLDRIATILLWVLIVSTFVMEVVTLPLSIKYAASVTCCQTFTYAHGDSFPVSPFYLQRAQRCGYLPNNTDTDGYCIKGFFRCDAPCTVDPCPDECLTLFDWCHNWSGCGNCKYGKWSEYPISSALRLVFWLTIAAIACWALMTLAVAMSKVCSFENDCLGFALCLSVVGTPLSVASAFFMHQVDPDLPLVSARIVSASLLLTLATILLFAICAMSCCRSGYD